MLKASFPKIGRWINKAGGRGEAFLILSEFQYVNREVFDMVSMMETYLLNRILEFYPELRSWLHPSLTEGSP